VGIGLLRCRRRRHRKALRQIAFVLATQKHWVKVCWKSGVHGMGCIVVEHVANVSWWAALQRECVATLLLPPAYVVGILRQQCRAARCINAEECRPDVLKVSGL
jgi:hypothetical protein